MEVLTSSEKLTSLLKRLRTGAKGVLLCDYDGTLAPFRDDPREACSYPWVPDILRDIAAGGTRLALVTGRTADDLLQLVRLHGVEVWGSHGRERVYPDGRRWTWKPDPVFDRVLDKIENELRQAAPGSRLERKVGCLALHWRGRSPAESEWLQKTAEQLREQFDTEGVLIVKPFHMGMELQIPGPDKGSVIATILDEEKGRDIAVCYMGDDRTDEDAFEALGNKGLCVLMSRFPRPTRADIRLENQDEVRAFLEQWNDAARGGCGHGK